MADITRLSRLSNGIQRQVDMSSNTLIVDNLKVKMGSGNDANHATFSGTLTAARTVTMPDAAVNLGAIATNTTHISSDGSDHSLVNTNTTHISSNGSDHSYVGNLQSLSGTSAGATTYAGDAFTGSIIPNDSTIKSALQALETQLGTVGGDSDFADDVFRISDQGDGTKKIAFQASVIATGTVRTITMPNTNIDLGDIATNTTHISSDGSDHSLVNTNTTHISSNGSDHSYVGNLQSLSGVAAASTHLGTFTGTTIADSQAIKPALQALETAVEANSSILAGWEWQDSALDYVDNTAVPPTEVTGNRYLLDDTGASHANWDGAAALSIVEFNGTSWVETAPSTGMIISLDDETTSIRQYSGSAWVQKYFESTTASTGLTKSTFDIQLANASAANGISVSSGAISAVLNASHLEIATNAISIKASAIDEAELNNVDGGIDAESFVLTSGYTPASGAVTAADTIQTAIEKLAYLADGNIYVGNGSNVATSVNPSGDIDISNTGVFSIAAGVIVNADVKSDAAIATSKLADASALGEAVTFFGSTDLSASEAETLSDGSNADALHSHGIMVRPMIAGETFAATTVFAVRMAMNGETDTRVYKADKDASSTDKFYVIGLVYPAGEVTAGNSIDVVMLGEITSSVAFTASQDEGKPVFLSTAGVLTLTAPTTADEAVVRVGMVSKVGAAATAKVMIQSVQVMGIN